MPDAARCPLCGERGRVPSDRTLRYAKGTVRSFALACPSCGLLSDADLDPGAARLLLDERLAEPRFEGRPADPFGLDIYTLRAAASAHRRGVGPADARQAAALAAPHADLAAHARLTDLARERPARVAIGAICRPREAEQAVRSLWAHRSWASEIVVMVDSAEGNGGEQDGVRVIARPLGGDFAAQRNALQEACGADWVLQLDADESLAAETGALLPFLAAQCAGEGIVSVGLQRCNRVDGVVSDLFPDVQYRLNRREIRYGGRVHERPVRAWQRSMIALHGTIGHDLSGAHVRARSERYETLDPGRGRLEETERLLTPYRP